MEPEAYLKKHQLLTYVEDAVTLLLERRDEDPNTKPFQLLTDYFESVLNGSHILFREYSFISATPHNRRSFIATFWQAFQKVAERGVAMSAFEYHSLLKLLCTDFPLEVTQKVGNVLSRRCDIIPFPDFAYTFQLVFYFEHFLQQLESVYSDLVLGTYRSPSSEGNPHSSHAVVVPLPPLSSGDCTSPCSNAQDSEKVVGGTTAEPPPEDFKTISSSTLLEAALSLVSRMCKRSESCPSPEALRETLSSEPAEQVSFRDFLWKLSRSKLINSEIGALPPNT